MITGRNSILTTCANTIYILLIFCFLSCQTGVIFQYVHGCWIFSYSFASSANEAISAMSVLKRIEEKKYEEANGILNALLDSHVLTYDNAKFSEDYIIPFSPILFVLEKKKFDRNMRKVLLFRSQYPSGNATVRNHIEEIKHKYQ